MDPQLLAALMSPPDIMSLKKILCIQPHPDDNEIGMGGIIAKLTSAGCRVDYLTVTDGGLGDIGLTDGQRPLAEIRREEAICAGTHLGAENFLFLDEKDGNLSDVPALAGKIAEILRSGGYDGVACPDPWNSYEAHHDHVITGLAATQAAINCNLLRYPEGTQTAPTQIKAVMLYFTQKINTVLDITEHFSRKMEAVALHKSQIDTQTLQLYTGYFAFRGQKMTGSRAIGEGVKALTPLHLHCIPEAAEI